MRLILRERKIYLAEKKYCCLCNADMEEDENKEMQEWFFPTDGFKRWYCSKCSEKAKSIEEEYIKRANNLREKHEYYNPLNLIMMVENLHIHRNTNIGIHFDNVFKYDKSIINAPILQDGKPIGVITNVTSEKVEGFIWERYMKLFAEFNSEQEPVAFELVYLRGDI